MSPRQARRIVESSDEESLPETWEEMQRNIEPVSPAAPEQRQVITIDDDDNTPQQTPLGGEPPFEVLLSMMADAPVPPQEPAPESPQPGPSGIEEMNQNAVKNEYSDEYFLRTIDASLER